MQLPGAGTAAPAPAHAGGTSSDSSSPTCACPTWTASRRSRIAAADADRRGADDRARRHRHRGCRDQRAPTTSSKARPRDRLITPVQRAGGRPPGAPKTGPAHAACAGPAWPRCCGGAAPRCSLRERPASRRRRSTSGLRRNRHRQGAGGAPLPKAAGAAGRSCRSTAPALPETLIESELFGHEVGAFTGADQGARRPRSSMRSAARSSSTRSRRCRRALQVKLLRVLQEREMQRLGCEHSRSRVDVRVVAASNARSTPLIARGTARAPTCYYRLDVVQLEAAAAARAARATSPPLFRAASRARAACASGVAAPERRRPAPSRLLRPRLARQRARAEERRRAPRARPARRCCRPRGATAWPARSLQATLDVAGGDADRGGAGAPQGAGRGDLPRSSTCRRRRFYRKLKAHGLQAKARRDR